MCACVKIHALQRDGKVRGLSVLFVCVCVCVCVCGWMGGFVSTCTHVCVCVCIYSV